MTKSELINEVHTRFGELTKKQIGEIFDALFTEITKAVKEEGRFSYAGYGILNVKTRPARTGRNPRTGNQIEIPEAKTVTFKPSTELKNTVNA